MIDLYAHLGNGFSLWPPGNPATGLNLTTGVQTLIGDLFSTALMRPGEHPIDPSFGFAPDLFENASNVVPELYEYNLNQALAKYFIGRISSYSIRVGTHPEFIGKLLVVIQFTPTESIGVHELSFGLIKTPTEFQILEPSVNGRMLFGGI